MSKCRSRTLLLLSGLLLFGCGAPADSRKAAAARAAAAAKYKEPEPEWIPGEPGKVYTKRLTIHSMRKQGLSAAEAEAGWVEAEASSQETFVSALIMRGGFTPEKATEVWHQGDGGKQVPDVK